MSLLADRRTKPHCQILSVLITCKKTMAFNMSNIALMHVSLLHNYSRIVMDTLQCLKTKGYLTTCMESYCQNLIKTAK